MILYRLRCSDGHEFEAWFKDAASFDEQSAAEAVSCPVCGDVKIVKAPMAPRLAKHHGEEKSPGEKAREAAKQMFATMEAVRKHVEENCDYVGDKFAEEARKIHYQETDERAIYGEASDEEASELSEEGIAFQRVNWISKRDD